MVPEREQEPEQTFVAPSKKAPTEPNNLAYRRRCSGWEQDDKKAEETSNAEEASNAGEPWYYAGAPSCFSASRKEPWYYAASPQLLDLQKDRQRAHRNSA
jgi:hypothetical protein